MKKFIGVLVGVGTFFSGLWIISHTLLYMGTTWLSLPSEVIIISLLMALAIFTMTVVWKFD